MTRHRLRHGLWRSPRYGFRHRGRIPSANRSIADGGKRRTGPNGMLVGPGPCETCGFTLIGGGL